MAQTQDQPQRGMPFDGAKPDPDLTPRVMALWDAGRDTCEIAALLGVHEAVAARCLRAGLEQRREQRRDQAVQP